MENIELVVYTRNSDNNFDVFINDLSTYDTYGSKSFPPETTLKEILEFGKKMVDKQKNE